MKKTDYMAGRRMRQNTPVKPQIISRQSRPMAARTIQWESIAQDVPPLAQLLATTGAGIVDSRDHTGADTDPLLKLGVPNFSPIQDSRFYFNYHHTAADTLDKIDPHKLAENAAINAVLAYGLANLEQPLP